MTPSSTVPQPSTRRRTSILFIAVATAFALVAVLAPARPAGAEGVSGEVTVFSNTVDYAGDGIRTPDIIATSPTNVVTVWREGYTAGQYDNGTLRYAFSTDGGQSWSDPRVMKQKDSEFGWHYAVLYRVGTDIYAFIGRSPAGAYNGQPVTNFMMKSINGGQTWTDHPIHLDEGVPAGYVVAGRPVKLGNHHIAPFWYDGKVAVLRSTDMVNWSAGAYAPDPDDTRSGESQIAISQDDPTKLVMVTRIGATADEYNYGPVYSYSATSADGGLTWSPLAEDRNIPNYQTKTYFTKSSTGQYLTIYNTFGGLFSGPVGDRPPLYREILNYKVKKPGQPWGPGRFFADGPKVVPKPHSAGWDTYPMADEYAPGKFFVVWEHDTSGIKVNKLDISDSFTGINEDWTTLAPWTATPAGGSASVGGGLLTLSNAAGTATTVSQPHAPGTGFIAAASGRLTTRSTLNTTTGVGANLAVQVANGARTLTFTVQSDGIYAKVSGAATWQRVLARTVDGAHHQYRAVVSAAGVARLYVDAVDTGVQWAIPAGATAKQSAVWTSGTAAAPAGAQLDWVSVEENVASTTWDDLSGWTAFAAGGSATSTNGELTLSSPTTGENGVRTFLQPYCDFSVDFRGQVTDYAPLNPSNGQGANLAVAATNGSRRLMLSIQSDGVYAIRKGESAWTRVYARADAGALASWRVDTNSGGEAKLFRNGGDTGARWTIQDKDHDPRLQVWSSGRTGDPAAAKVDWLRATCNLR